MNVLIVKLNAAGDVVRTTTLLRQLQGRITWISAKENLPLLEGLIPSLRSMDWESRELAKDRTYDLIINLEDEIATAQFVADVPYRRIFGAFLNAQGVVTYTEDSRRWFDMSLISMYGRKHADQLKLENRRTYQEMIFEGLGLTFEGDPYHLPASVPTALSGDVAIAPVAGPVWPMKGWDHYEQLQKRLENDGLKVNVLPRRPTILQHLGDVQQHQCLVCGDSLPMHLALGSGVRCITLFNCTSPWEIYDYGIQTKIVSPHLERFFYQRGLDPAATSAIELEGVYQAVVKALDCSVPSARRKHS